MGRARLPSVADLKRIPAGERWPRLRARAQHHRQQLAVQDQEPCEATAIRRRAHHAKQLRIIANVAEAAGLEPIKILIAE